MSPRQKSFKEILGKQDLHVNLPLAVDCSNYITAYRPVRVKNKNIPAHFRIAV